MVDYFDFFFDSFCIVVLMYVDVIRRSCEGMRVFKSGFLLNECCGLESKIFISCSFVSVKFDFCNWVFVKLICGCEVVWLVVFVLIYL